MNITKTKLTTSIASIKTPRSVWAKGVAIYAAELVESLEKESVPIESLKTEMLNGAKDWIEYSFGGCALIYNGDICERLCSPSEIKKTRNGERQPNSHESWLDCQARAIGQAFRLVSRLATAA